MTVPVDDPFTSPFLKALVRQMRAEDTHGSWDAKSDAEILKAYLLTREQRREIPILGDPDPDVLWRLELFYRAVGLAIEQETGTIASPMMKMSHEGWGRIILTAGRLVVLSKHLRDVHRFGFETLGKMAGQGDRLVQEGVAAIARFPDVVKA
ncbi:MAG: NifX-associated nitrogen fixation protein [Alphaproteobacteria bacterium]|nr:NifX-associated nitrogen fixation protein [Alphaproteobacteria bacterium]